jgi:glucose-1-phosphate cytidylyltransferase
MKVVILAGGFGTRLSEETVLKPKPMVEIGQKPILWHIMKTYSYYGFNDFVILLGYKGYYIKEYFSNYFLHQSDVTFDLKNNKMQIHSSSTEDWKVSLIDTGENTMTGGRIKRIQQFIGNENFLLTYGDGVANINISDLIAFHNSHDGCITMTSSQPAGRFGALNIDTENRITKFLEKPKGDGRWINAGYFVCDSKVFDFIEPDDSIVFEDVPLKNLANAKQMYTYKHEGFWMPMDSLKDKNDLTKMCEMGIAPWIVW